MMRGGTAGARTVYSSLMLLLTRATPLLRSQLVHGEAPEEPEDISSPDFWFKILLSAALVVLGGIFAGLTLGLMGLDELHLRVLATSSDDEKERENAKKVLRLLGKGRHWVLVVLLLGNVIVNESLPIFLDSAIGGGVAAVVISTVAIVIFGEVIPQSVCVRYGLTVGAVCAPAVLILMWIMAPIAWPIAKLLDWVLGAHSETTYKKAELKSFLQFHRTGEEPLRDDEINILNGVLELNNKSVEEIMTPLRDVVALSSDTILDHHAVDCNVCLRTLHLLSGYSRFPVHEPNNPLAFTGLLLIKKVFAICLPVSAFTLSILPEADPSINCFQALDYFQTGRAHILIISNTPGKPGGAIGRIVDETDRYEDNQSKRKARRMTTSSVMRGIVERSIRQNSIAIGNVFSYGTMNVARPVSTVNEHPESDEGATKKL
ncbi:hypothetical protein DL96DRAFT_1611632 [Flagelloscypha sp. PMI_526]|nr:hypothetical protein DL96DRAFT_1611632 [Flagelloscypha sp. PMI_526]